MDYLDIRKNAYIDALTLSKTTTIVSLWGRIPWEIVESFGVKSVYSYGIDKEVTEDYSDNNYCDMLNSSFAYLELGRCPFMFSSSFFIVDDSCKIRYETLKKKTDKDVFVYKYKDYTSLIGYLLLYTNSDSVMSMRKEYTKWNTSPNLSSTSTKELSLLNDI